VAVEVSLNGGADFSISRREFTFQQAPTVTDLVPSSGASGTSGREVTVIGAHFDQGEDLSCAFGRNAQVKAHYLTSSLVTCRAALTRAGSVSVGITQHGIEAVGSGLQFAVVPAYAGWTLHPSQGPAAGGNLLTIKGDVSFGVGMTGDCLFGAQRVEGEVLDDSSMRCVVPAGAAGRVVSVLATGLEEGGGSSAGQPYQYLAQVEIASAWPTRGSMPGGTLVSITGSGFDLQAGVFCRFGLVPVDEYGLRVITSSLVTCLSPATHETGSVALAVSDGAGGETSSGLEFLYEQSATVEGVRPSASALGRQGQVVTVSGRHFVQSSALSCRFGMGMTGPATFLSTSLVVCRAPERGPGLVNVMVSNNGVDTSVGSAQFVYAPRMAAVSALPSRGPTSGGTMVTVGGSLSDGDDTPLRCMFGAISVIATKTADGGVVCGAPASAESGEVELRLHGEDGARGESIAVRFLYFRKPEVQGLSPWTGSFEGGTLIHVSGLDFLGDGVTCRFGAGQELGKGRSVSSTLVSCVTPAATSSGLVSVEVSFNGGADFSSNGHRFMYEEPAMVEALVPSAVRSGEAGQVVTVLGRHFGRNSELSCQFGRNSLVAVLQHVSSSAVVCAVPGQIAGTVTVSVSNNGVDAGAMGRPLVVEMQRSLVSLRPSKGPVQGGSVVLIEVGGGLSVGAGSVTCLFGGSRVQGHILEGWKVECVAAGVKAAGNVKVEVEGVSGLAGQLDFEYYFAPTVKRLVPSRGALSGGSTVTLHGAGFAEEGLRCRFGMESGEGQGQYMSSSMVLCVAPGVVEAGAVVVDVSNNEGADFSGEGQEYSYEKVATVEAVLPSRGQAGGAGQVVTVIGKHFVRDAGLSCSFGLNSSTGIREHLSSTLVTCVAARKSAGTVSVGVSVHGGDIGAGTGRFVFGLERSIAGMVPSEGPVDGGSKILLRLEGPWDILERVSVQFGRDMRYAEVINGTYAEVVSPKASAAGAVKIESADVTVQDLVQYVYHESPDVLALWPTRGPTAGVSVVSVTLNNQDN